MKKNKLLYRRQSPIIQWLLDHPEAREYVEMWMDMIKDGKRVIGLRDLMADLAEDYGCPFVDPTAFGRRLREYYGERYDAVRGRAGMRVR